MGFWRIGLPSRDVVVEYGGLEAEDKNLGVVLCKRKSRCTLHLAAAHVVHHQVDELLQTDCKYLVYTRSFVLPKESESRFSSWFSVRVSTPSIRELGSSLSGKRCSKHSATVLKAAWSRPVSAEGTEVGVG